MIARANFPAGSTYPRLAYVSGVPIRSISAGPAVLHRLLATYPGDDLIICEADDNVPDPPNQLRGVEHVRFHLSNRRLLCSRLSPYYSRWVFLRAASRASQFVDRLRRWKPDGILTVAHGFGWITATAAARRLGVPLHVIAHDHWRDTISLLPHANAEADRQFAAAYQGAAARMPISPAMAERYARDYRAAGTVLYPCRPPHVAPLRNPPLREPTGCFTFAYAGAAAATGQRRALIDFANTIAATGARLLVYQQLSLPQLRAEGLAGDNLVCVPFRPAEEMRRDLIARVDALYLPMSFAPEDRANVELCFPSKLVDYTSVGLPIIVRCPNYGTAATWAREFPETAALVTDPNPAPLLSVAQRLMHDIPYRQSLAAAALRTGTDLFSHDAVFGTFLRCVCPASKHGI